MKAFYVTMKRETQRHGTKTAWLLGPYATHEEALELVHTARGLAEEVDPRCVWDAFGTSSITMDVGGLGEFPQGKLNAAVEMVGRVA